MAGEIFVGSVSVGVVPDLRGFNDRMRVELVPAANRIGQEMGREMSRGIMEGLDIGRIISESTAKAQVVARKAGYDLGLSYGRAFRRGFELALEGWKPKVTVQVDADTLAARAAIDRLGGTVTERVRTTGGGGSSGRSGGGGGDQGGGGVIGGIGSLIRALPGGTSGSVGAVPATVGIPAAIAGAVALPFIGQILAGVVPAVLGGGLAALGIGGALGLPGQLGAQQVDALHGKAIAAQDRVAASQAKLNALRQSGKATAIQLTTAEGTLATQQATAATAQNKYQQARQSQLTGSQLQVRNAFENIAINARQSLAQIGASFVPVMLSIAGTVQSVMDKMTPVFATAVKTISGPFKLFSDVFIKSLASPQVASSIQAIAKAFTDVMTAFTPDIPGIVNSFADAIERIAKAVSKNPKAFADFLNFFFQVGIAVLNGIAFLADFAAWIETHWNAIWDSIKRTVAQALGPIAANVARMVMYVISHFGELRHGIAHEFDLIRHGVAAQWDLFWSDTIGRAINGQRRLQELISNMLHNLAHYFDIFRHGVAAQWDLFWSDTIGLAINGQRRLQALISAMLHWIANAFDVTRHAVASIWDSLWSGVANRAINAWHRLMSIFGSLKNDIINFFKSASNWLIHAGEFVIQGLFNGIKNTMSGISNWIKNNVVDPLINAVKHFFGIHSPASVMVPLGASLITGLIKGMLTSAKDLGKFVGSIFGGWPEALAHLIEKSFINIGKLPAKAIRALAGVAGKIGGFAANLFRGGPAGAGVERWLPTIKVALMLNNLPDSLAAQVAFQMRTESGGNPNAINLWDINAQRGDPSRGLMQTIGSTFAAYHIPGTSSNIYDPLANIAAAINYAKHVYGPSLMRGGMGMGSGHGYDDGGWWPTGTFGWNTSGQHELVVTEDQLRAAAIHGGHSSSGPTYIAHFDSLTGAAIESHVRTAYQAMSMTQGNLNRQGRRR